jgi:hypothetical protein
MLVTIHNDNYMCFLQDALLYGRSWACAASTRNNAETFSFCTPFNERYPGDVSSPELGADHSSALASVMHLQKPRSMSTVLCNQIQ